MAIAENAKPQVPTALAVRLKTDIYDVVTTRLQAKKATFNPDEWELRLVACEYDDYSADVKIQMKYKIPTGEDARRYRNTTVDVPVQPVSWEDIFARLGLAREYHYSQFDEVNTLLQSAGLYTTEHDSIDGLDSNTRILHVYPWTPGNNRVYIVPPDHVDDSLASENRAQLVASLAKLTRIEDTGESTPELYGDCYIKFTREVVTDTDVTDVGEGLTSPLNVSADDMVH